MADYEVTCIDKPRNDSPHEAITHLGSRGWRWTQNAVMDAIVAETNTFYTLRADCRSDIIVVHGPNGHHVQTIVDGELTDDLLSLPGCSGYL